MYVGETKNWLFHALQAAWSSPRRAVAHRLSPLPSPRHERQAASVKLDECQVYKMKKVQRKSVGANTSSFLLLFDLPHSFPHCILTLQSFSGTVKSLKPYKTQIGS